MARLETVPYIGTEYFVWDPKAQLFLGRNFSGWRLPLWSCGFGSKEDAERHVLEHAQEYIRRCNFGDLAIVKGAGARYIMQGTGPTGSAVGEKFFCWERYEAA